MNLINSFFKYLRILVKLRVNWRDVIAIFFLIRAKADDLDYEKYLEFPSIYLTFLVVRSSLKTPLS